MKTEGNDGHKCSALLNEGRWLSKTAWQPSGCMINTYSAPQVTSCLVGRHVVFIGDSTVRQVFFALVRYADPKVDITGEKHTDREIMTQGIKFSFYWDPYLNETASTNLLAGKLGGAILSGSRPTMAVVGSGLWYLRQPSSGGVEAWKRIVDRIFAGTLKSGVGQSIADEVILLPVEEVVEERMSAERAATVHRNDIAVMNDYLMLKQGDLASNLAIPRVFNKIIEGRDDQTEDGFHFSDAVTKVQANVLLNLRCNDVMPKKFPFDKTCCSQYPLPNWVQVILLIVLLLWAPTGLYLYSRRDLPSYISSTKC